MTLRQKSAMLAIEAVPRQLINYWILWIYIDMDMSIESMD